MNEPTTKEVIEAMRASLKAQRDSKPRPYDDATRIGNRKQVKPYPGLFDYAGFGYGTYYSADGLAYWCSGSQANHLAFADGVKYDWWDELAGYKGVYLGD